ncbi:MAG: hypothetical protein KDA22_12385 [Phycisphaerales bacterium]|nr:hypothetical protein [Phycisphaerales bacterium]
MKRSSRLLGWCIVAAGLLGTTGLVQAQGSPILNRRIGEVAVLPSPTGGWNFQVLWTVEANGTSAGANQGTTIAVFVGSGAEVPVATATVAVNLDFTDGLCGITGCTGGCGGGFIDGVFNTMLCLEDPPCPAGNCDCTCRFPWITSNIPGIDLSPGDEITVILYPASGAMPENDESDDARTFVFDGEPRFWNVGLGPAQKEPVAGSDLFNIVGSWEIGERGIQGMAELTPIIQLVVNGSVQAQYDACSGNPWILAPGNACPGGGGCSSDECATGSCAGSNVVLHCKLAKCLEGAIQCCICTSDPQFFVIPNVLLLPNDEVKLVLMPAPGALPTLPGFEDDDSVPVDPPCAADLDGDGQVNGSDLGIMLGAWGTPGPGDLNDDGTVDGSDLGLLLGAWGDCFPV